MKNQIALCMTAALALLLSACGAGAQSPGEEICKALELDVSGCEVMSSSDDHRGFNRGFHGDGISFVELSCPGGGVLEQIKKDNRWKAFPLDRVTQALTYGVTEKSGSGEGEIAVFQTGPYLTGGEGDPLVPEIQEGYYRLIDRHAQAGETDLLGRASLNFTLALYDTGTDTLYFYEMDT